MWQGGGNPSVVTKRYNPTLKGIYSAPYLDHVVQEFIISAFYPIYFGDYYWGIVATDILMSETKTLIEEYKPTASAFSILVNDKGDVILGSERALNILFNLSLIDGYLSIVSSNVTTPSLEYYFLNAKKASSAGIKEIMIVNISYFIVYQRLESLKDWVFFVFAPYSELNYDVQVNQTSYNRDVKFLEQLSFGITLANKGVLNVHYYLSTPEWLEVIEEDFIQSNESRPLPGSTKIELAFNFIGINSGIYNGIININIEDDTASLCYIQNYQVLVNIEVAKELKLTKLNNDASLAVFISSILSLLIPIGLIIFIAYFRDNLALKQISPVFTIITLVGSILFQISPIFLTHEAPYCMAWWWFLSTGFVIFFGSLIMKAFRIERIFRNADKLKVSKNLTNKHIFPGVCILLGIQIILLIAWTIVTPLSLIEDSDGQYVKVICGSSNPARSTIFYSIQCVYAVLFIGSGCYYSFKTRNISFRNFREAKEMMFAIYNFSILVIIITGLVASNTLDPTGFTIAVGIGTMLASIGSLAMLLGKRVHMTITNQIDSSDSSKSKSKSKSKSNKKVVLEL